MQKQIYREEAKMTTLLEDTKMIQHEIHDEMKDVYKRQHVL